MVVFPWVDPNYCLRNRFMCPVGAAEITLRKDDPQFQLQDRNP